MSLKILRHMAALVRTGFDFAFRRFKTDAHWDKLTRAVSTSSLPDSIKYLEDYKGKPIEYKVNQLVLKLLDEDNFQGILCLVAALRRHEMVTDFARVSESGAMGMLSNNWFAKYKEVRSLAESLAAECRAQEGEVWLKRAPFFDRVGRAVVSQSQYVAALHQLTVTYSA